MLNLLKKLKAFYGLGRWDIGSVFSGLIFLSVSVVPNSSRDSAIQILMVGDTGKDVDIIGVNDDFVGVILG